MSSPPVGIVQPPARVTEPSTSLKQLKALLRATLRVTVADGRVFVGTFAGTDKQLNVILVGTDEYRVAPDAGPEWSSRYVGQVMVPWRLIQRVEAKSTGGASYHGDSSGWPVSHPDSEEEAMYT